MNPLKLRRVLITLHLWLAGLMAPAFLVVAISGALHILGGQEQTRSEPIEIPVGIELNIGSPEFEDEVQTLIDEMNLPVKMEYIRGRGNGAQTRPTSRPYLSFQQTPDGVSAEMNYPNFQASLMELHKGHGPRIYRFYQMFVGIVLFFVVVGGLAVGVLAKNYRRSTLIATAVGLVATTLLAIL